MLVWDFLQAQLSLQAEIGLEEEDIGLDFSCKCLASLRLWTCLAAFVQITVVFFHFTASLPFHFMNSEVRMFRIRMFQCR